LNCTRISPGRVFLTGGAMNLTAHALLCQGLTWIIYLELRSRSN